MKFQKGHKHSEESKRKMSIARKGKSSWNKGLRGVSGQKKGFKHSKETKVNIAKSLTGRKLSEETKKKIGIASKGNKYCLGKTLSEEHKNKIRIANQGKKRKLTSYRREMVYNWKGGYENTLMLNRKRRILKLKAEGSHVLYEWENLKIQYNLTCPSCKRREPEIKLTEDHIIPLSKGGSDNIENIQPLCRNCNCKKYNKIIKYNN